MRWVVLLGLTLLVSACSSLPFQARTVRVTLADIRLAEVGQIEQVFTLKLRTQNPESRPLAVEGFSYEMEVLGRDFAKGVSSRFFNIPAYREDTVEVRAVGSVTSLLDRVARLHGERPKVVRYRLTGQLNAAGGLGADLPFEFAGEIPLSLLAPEQPGLDQPANVDL